MKWPFLFIYEREDWAYNFPHRAKPSIKGAFMENKLRQSIPGILSVVFGLIALCPIGLGIFVAIDSDPGGDFAFAVIFLLVIGSFCVFTPLMLILGLIGLFQKDRSKLFPIIGLSFFAFYMFVALVGLFFVFI